MDLFYHAGTSDSNALRDAWVVFLRRWTWQWFCTFTFREIVHPESADKRFRLLISKLNRQIHGPRWHKKGLGVGWVRALEYQRRGVIHYHALVAGVGAERRLTWMDIWDELAGFARIEPIRDDSAVRRYVSKYVIKGGELDLGGPLRSPRLPLFPTAHPQPGYPPQPARSRSGQGWAQPTAQPLALDRASGAPRFP
jgi:hypothetical protein